MSDEKAESKQRKKTSISMHDDVEVWDDCCSCEMEPYWSEAMEDEDSRRDDEDARGDGKD